MAVAFREQSGFSDRTAHPTDVGEIVFHPTWASPFGFPLGNHVIQVFFFKMCDFFEFVMGFEFFGHCLKGNSAGISGIPIRGSHLTSNDLINLFY
jgi:hypothetical protein